MRKCKHFYYKKFLSKKVVWAILVVMIASLITIPKIITRANNYQTIKVLEVEPGNRFILADNTTDDANQMNVVVTKVDMPTFISMVDDIDGKYDVVYIGRNIKLAGKNDLTGYWDTDPEDIYRDYSAPFKYPRVDDTSNNQEKTILQGDNLGTNIVDRLQAQAYWYGTLGLSTGDTFKKDAAYNFSQTWNTQAQNGNVTTSINGVTKKVKEYYSENDITKRRANEIIKMIKSNQLVYVNNGVFSSDLDGTNLKSIFNSSDLASYSNYQKVGSLSNNQIIQYYAKNLANSLKRPTVTNVTGPKNDDWNAIATDTIDQKIVKRKDNRNMSFSFDLTKPDQNTQYQAILYLDFNADGMFQDNEAVPISNVEPRTCINVNSGTNTINYTLRNDFVGYLDWKIEVYNSSSPNVKTNVYGNAIYKRTGANVSIKVLQLAAADNTPYPNNLDLTSSTGNFHNQITDSKVIDDYTIKITKENVSDFNTQCDKLNTTDPNDPGTRNFINSYDMIIFGFADCYGNLDANNFSDKSIQIINMFNNEHKSLMFTHDTISLNALGNSTVTFTDKSNTNSFSNSANKLTQYFRDIVGQSRYADPYNNNSSIYHDPSVNDNPSLNTIMLGATAYASPTLYDRSMVAPNTCSTVRLINKGDINSYPFNLSSYDNNNMLVERTHVQWYQINLEDPDVVPWYNLSTGNLSANNNNDAIYFNTGDSRNFYYTYSRANITFSGTGHTGSSIAVGGYTNEESQLFVNTIIKAIRGANVPPQITNYDINKTTIYSDNYQLKVKPSQAFQFSSLIYDQDGKVGDNIPVKITTDDNKILFDGILKYQIGGVYKDITLDSAYLISRIGQTIKVTVSATDVYQAKDTKTFSIQVDPLPIQIYHSTVKPTAQTTGTTWDPSNIDTIVDIQGLTKDYYTVVPYVAYISMFNTGANLALTLDSKFSGAYSDSDYLVPTVYVVNNGSLKYLGTMTSNDNINYTYPLDKNIVGSNATIDSNGNCDIVIRYNCKTYNHNSDGSPLQYLNNITVSRAGLPDSSQNASIYVGFKPLNGTLY